MAISDRMAQYSVAEAKNNLPKLLARAQAGEEVTITKRGKPIAHLVAAAPRAMSIDLEWLDRVRVKPSDPSLDFTQIIRQMRDEGY